MRFHILSLLALAISSIAHPHNTGKPHNKDSGWSLQNFKSLVVFGDSYSDEARLSYFVVNNGTAPPVGWVQPVSNHTSTGGYIWGRYVAWYTGAHFYDYAVSGAVCSNQITPRNTSLGSVTAPFPDVQGYEIPAFEADKAHTNPETNAAFLDIPPDETVYAMWIGTNDLGNGAFLTDAQVRGKTLADYLDCVYDALDRLYNSGGRYFVLLNVIPLNLAPLYALPGQGGLETTHYWPRKPSNTTEISFRMEKEVVLVDEAFKYRTPYEVRIANRYPEATFASFDVWSLFNDMYHNPASYFNGSAPANLTGFINQCNANGTDCVLAESPDSYLWYDELHPSEQADRNVAKEFVKVVQGNSQYATYW